MTRKIIILLLCAVALTACLPDPRREAAAYETRTLADQQARDLTAAREQTVKLNEIELRDAKRRQIIKDAGMANAEMAAGWLTFWGGIALTLTACMLLLATGVGGSVAIVGTGRAVAIAAQFKANQIQLDRVTRQYPLLRHVHGTRWMIENPNTGQVLALDEKNEPHKLLISAMAAVQHAGVLAREANKNNDVSIIQPLRLEENSQ